MTEIDCDMFDKAVNRHHSVDCRAARGDPPEVGLHRVPFSRGHPSAPVPMNLFFNCSRKWALSVWLFGGYQTNKQINWVMYGLSSI